MSSLIDPIDPPESPQKTILCTLHGIGPLLAGREHETSLSIHISQWDSLQSIQNRILSEIDDNPLSGKFIPPKNPNSITQTLESIDLFSLQYTLSKKSSTPRFRVFWDTITSSPQARLWEPFEALFSWIHFALKQPVEEGFLLQGFKDAIDMFGEERLRIVHEQNNPTLWHSNIFASTVLPWKENASLSKNLPLLDGTLSRFMDSDEEDPEPWLMNLVGEDKKNVTKVSDRKHVFIYDSSGENNDGKDLSTIFRSLRISSWVPNMTSSDFATAMLFESTTSGSINSKSQVVSSSNPFPWESIPVSFFPFLETRVPPRRLNFFSC